jgi:hypothetical protein
MITVLAMLFAFVAALALLDLAATVFGFDSRDGFADDHRR